MQRRTATRVSQAIALAGVCVAIAIYTTAADVADNPLGYDPLTNKKYVHDLERLGGKANVATAELMQWFDGLWHGRSLGVTIGVLSVGFAWLFWWFATLPKMPPAHEKAAHPR